MDAVSPMLRQAGRWLRRGALMVALAGAASVASAQSAGADRRPRRRRRRAGPTGRPWSGLWSWRSDGKPPPPTGVQSPHYGDSLFYFYQGALLHVGDAA